MDYQKQIELLQDLRSQIYQNMDIDDTIVYQLSDKISAIIQELIFKMYPIK